MMTADRVFKIFTADQWSTLERDGIFEGSADDLRDGYIHMSAGPEVEATLAKHFAGQSGLVIAEIATERLGPALKWEVSRGGALFPHLYRPLKRAEIIDSKVIPPR
jgi:uncharacterized protein (DUF952 family)